jgi:predicted permease
VSRFRRILRIRDNERDLEEELSFHREQVVAELRARGVSEEAARAEASRQFGDEARYRAELRAIDAKLVRKVRWNHRFIVFADAWRAALRTVRTSPGLSLGVVATFALGIGANATVLGLTDRLLLRAPPQVHEPERVFHVLSRFTRPNGDEGHWSVRSYPELVDFAQAKTLSSSAGYNFSTNDVTIGRGADAQRAKSLLITGNYFGLIGVRPALGRLLTAQDDRVDATAAVVLSHGYWQRHYGRADAIGKTIDFGRGPYEIIGVLPKGFAGLDLQRVDLFVPAAQWRGRRDGQWHQRRTSQWLYIVVRLAPGVTPEQAAAELTVLNRAGNAELIDRQSFPKDLRVVLASLIPGRNPMAPAELKVSKWLVAVSLIVLLIACTNITNLLLARAVRELRGNAVRLAIGITRARLLTQVALEIVLFAVAGGVAALLVARVSGRALQRLMLPDYGWDAIGFDGLMVWAILGLSILAGAAAALMPALQVVRANVIEALRSGSVSGSRTRVRHALVVFQVALSVVLLFGAGLFLRSFRNAADTDLGIEPRAAYWLSPYFDDGVQIEPEEWFSRVVRAIQPLPGVTAASASSTLPFYQFNDNYLRAEGVDSLPEAAAIHAFEGDYFGALGLTIEQGRVAAAGAGEVMVSRHFANLVFRGQALDRCLYIGQDATQCSRIVGVVEDAMIRGLRRDTVMQYYVPAAQVPERPLWGISVRVADRQSATATVEAARREIFRADPRVRYVNVESLEDMIGAQLRPWQMGASLFTLFGALAFLVAMIGLYGVLAFDVAQRTRELGLRAALGASPAHLLAVVMSKALQLCAIGVGGGLTITVLFAPRLQELLYDVPARDPLGLALVALLIMSIGMLAAALPAARAQRASPLVAMRLEG